ncbi:SMP-30/gluconolactonase/LRE family protein [Brucella intermedia]|uniref:SMP-30/gluconolactonase/LRE family protein n=1 Tax=Brucella intermedia TaxID=94625 RepID=UPI00209AE06A|nr:SMP-30/gluconolactonase/LRE family protein [Brucella intermedia]MCO7728725.1 SMP-30/gluconolactonase/LRE family protein [Brucella intermedia]
MSSTLLMAGVAAAAISCGAPDEASHKWSPPEVLIQPSPFHGVNGLVVDDDNRLIVGSLFGGQVWSVDRSTGAAEIRVDAPYGQSDDVAISPTGGLAWTSLLEGKVRYQEKNSDTVQELASLPSINSIRFDEKTGRLYAAQVFGADALWEIDRQGNEPPRLIARDLGGLNGFDVGADGMIYGPLMEKGEVARVNPENGQVAVIASGFSMPTGVKIAADGNLWVVDTVGKSLTEVDKTTGEKTSVAKFDGPLDNLAIGPDGEIYVSDVSRNAIHAYNTKTGEVREVTPPRIAIPAGLGISNGQLWIANGYVLRSLDTKSNKINEKFPDIPAAFPFTVSLSEDLLAISSTSTNVVEVFNKRSGERITQIGNLSGASDAILLSNGNLIYSEYGAGRIVRAYGEDFSKRDTISVNLDGPIQMAAAGTDRLYVTENSGAVVEVSLSTSQAPRQVVTGLNKPEGIALTSWGTLVVAEVGAHRLIEINPKSGEKAVIAENLPIGHSVPSSLPAYAIPTGVALDRDDTIYFSSDVSNAIYKTRLEHGCF